jgi:division protein CdvB (Snf7/Vps24/ESCRT-III family)
MSPNNAETELSDYVLDVITGDRTKELIAALKRTSNQLRNVTSRLFSLAVSHEDKRDLEELMEQQQQKMQNILNELQLIQ